MHDFGTCIGFLICLQFLRRLKRKAHIWAGAPCSSWVWISRGSTGRCRLRPRGRRTSKVRQANRFIRRLCFALLCLEFIAQMFCFVLKGFVGKWLIFANLLVCSSKIGVWPSKGLLLDNRAAIQQHLTHVWRPRGDTICEAASHTTVCTHVCMFQHISNLCRSSSNVTKPDLSTSTWVLLDPVPRILAVF